MKMKFMLSYNPSPPYPLKTPHSLLDFTSTLFSAPPATDSLPACGRLPHSLTLDTRAPAQPIPSDVQGFKIPSHRSVGFIILALQRTASTSTRIRIPRVTHWPIPAA